MEQVRRKRRVDLGGQIFGHLTVIEPATTQDGYAGWRCRCECGQECVARTSALRDGSKKSCGCAQGGEAMEMTGQRFGCLVVIERAESTGRSGAQWTCRCDCGSTCIARGHELHRGKRTSCGCMRGKWPRTKPGNGPQGPGVLPGGSDPLPLTSMDEATLASVAIALMNRSAALEAEAQQITADEPDGRANAGSAPMRVFVKQQVAQEFRNLADQILRPGTSAPR